MAGGGNFSIISLLQLHQHTPPSHSHPPVTTIPQSTLPPLWIFLPSAPFPPPRCFTQPLPAVLSSFPPFFSSLPWDSLPKQPPLSPQAGFPKSGLPGITPTPLPSKNNLHIWPLENFASLEEVFKVCLFARFCPKF